VTPEIPLHKRKKKTIGPLAAIPLDTPIVVPNIHQTSIKMVEKKPEDVNAQTKWKKLFNFRMFSLLDFFMKEGCTRCGCKKNEKGKSMTPCWYIKEVLCDACLKADMISHEELKVVYNIKMREHVKLLGSDEKKTFLQAVYNTCYFFINSRDHKQYTSSDINFNLCKGVRLLFFSKTQLSKIIDLDFMENKCREESEAAKILQRFMVYHRLNANRLFLNRDLKVEVKSKRMERLKKLNDSLYWTKQVYTHLFPRNGTQLLHDHMKRNEKKCVWHM
jgi:hypothetical protein